SLVHVLAPLRILLGFFCCPNKFSHNLFPTRRSSDLALQEKTAVSTFKVAVKRANKSFPIRSQEMNQRLGAHLLKNTTGITVDVHQPDVEIKVDIREKATYITSATYPGSGGLPV